MYDELVKRLREEAEPCDRSGCVQTAKEMRQAADAIEELQGRAKVLEKLADHWCEAVPKWIPVTERLPKEEKEIYWCCTNMGIMCECRWTNNRWGLGESDKWGWNIMDVPQYQKVTHWMPLPEPPKEET